ncbi:MAG: hypothetical protein IJ640_05000 [Prevotella sp.]|nr:hypothetical protein [Prevotella sp.]
MMKEETRICRRCGETKPITKFLRTGKTTRRHVCNHCFYVETIKPCMERRIIRMLDERKANRKNVMTER